MKKEKRGLTLTATEENGMTSGVVVEKAYKLLGIGGEGVYAIFNATGMVINFVLFEIMWYLGLPLNSKRFLVFTVQVK